MTLWESCLHPYSCLVTVVTASLPKSMLLRDIWITTLCCVQSVEPKATSFSSWSPCPLQNPVCSGHSQSSKPHQQGLWGCWTPWQNSMVYRGTITLEQSGQWEQQLSRLEVRSQDSSLLCFCLWPWATHLRPLLPPPSWDWRVGGPFLCRDTQVPGLQGLPSPTLQVSDSVSRLSYLLYLQSHLSQHSH